MSLEITIPKPGENRWPQRKYKSIRDYATALLLRVDYIDEEGRKVGFNYDHILKLIHRTFPVVTYKGPKKGRPVRMIHAHLHQLSYDLNQKGIVLPMRPRRKRVRKIS